ncbi:unnamed protein product, partial [Prorocentrum cordatum]
RGCGRSRRTPAWTRRRPRGRSRRSSSGPRVSAVGPRSWSGSCGRRARSSPRCGGSGRRRPREWPGVPRRPPRRSRRAGGGACRPRCRASRGIQARPLAAAAPSWSWSPWSPWSPWPPRRASAARARLAAAERPPPHRPPPRRPCRRPRSPSARRGGARCRGLQSSSPRCSRASCVTRARRGACQRRRARRGASSSRRCPSSRRALPEPDAHVAQRRQRAGPQRRARGLARGAPGLAGPRAPRWTASGGVRVLVLAGRRRCPDRCLPAVPAGAVDRPGGARARCWPEAALPAGPALRGRRRRGRGPALHGHVPHPQGVRRRAGAAAAGAAPLRGHVRAGHVGSRHRRGHPARVLPRAAGALGGPGGAGRARPRRAGLGVRAGPEAAGGPRPVREAARWPPRRRLAPQALGPPRPRGGG